MKNILKTMLLYLLLVSVVFSVPISAQENLPFAYQSTIDSLTNLQIIPSDYEAHTIATRYDAMYLLARATSVNRFAEQVTIEDIPTQYADIPKDSAILPALHWADMTFFCGKAMSDGSIVADLNSQLSKKEAIVMCLRVILSKEIFQLKSQHCDNTDEYLIFEATNYGLVNYSIGDKVGVEVTEANLNEPISFAELCAMIYQTMHAPIITNTYGGYRITYIIDEYLPEVTNQ
ncbi:MAG: hypothetical protein J6K51_02345 [Clostridia bacterium]|nr:hypothetical protein [Clostridia bacterium]